MHLACKAHAPGTARQRSTAPPGSGPTEPDARSAVIERCLAETIIGARRRGACYRSHEGTRHRRPGINSVLRSPGIPAMTRDARLLHLLALLFACTLLSICAAPANATDYLFHVSCDEKRFIAEWNTGSIDPGREYLRTVTGTKFPECSVRDYNAETDGDLPRERYSHEGGVVQGIPFVGPILCGIFNC